MSIPERPKFPTGDKIETCPVKDWRGETFAELTLYKSTTRTTGRRIIVRGPGGKILYDGDEAHDHANAVNRLQWWLYRHLGPDPALAERFAAGHVPPKDDMTHNAYLTWKERQAADTPTDELPADQLPQPDPIEIQRLYDDGCTSPGEGGGGGE